MIEIIKNLAAIIFPIVAVLCFLGASNSYKRGYEIESRWRLLNAIFFAVMEISIQISQWNG